MNRFSRLCAHAWLVTLLGAIALLCRIAADNLAQADRLSNLADGDAIAVDAASPTGYVGGLRKLVLPEMRHETFEAIAQTQQMLATGDWRLRHIDSDNAPVGRTNFAPSPFRWWLAGVAWADSRLNDRPLGQSVERAAILAGPALQILLMVGATLFAVRFLGPLTAGVVPLALAFLFPLAGNSLSPLAGERVLTQAVLLGAVLPLAAALAAPRTAGVVRALFLVAGVCGGLALWLDVGPTVPLLTGVVLGGLWAGWRQRRTAAETDTFHVAALPWRTWAWAGAVTSLLAYLVEYAPAHLGGLRLDRNHPLYALAWVGGAELLVRGLAWVTAGRRQHGARDWVALGAAAVAVLAPVVGALLADGNGLFGSVGRNHRLALWPGTGAAKEVLAWLLDAPAWQLFAVLLPLVVLVPAGWATFARRSDRLGDAVALVAGPVLVLFVVSCWQLALWAALDVALLALFAVLTVEAARRSSGVIAVWAAVAVLALAPAAWKLSSGRGAEAGAAVSDLEFEALLHRDLAQWLVGRAPEGGVIALAPPAMTSALYFYGGIRGFGTPDPASTDGMAAAVRICGSTSSDEGEALSRKRGITHVLMPSWDPMLEEYARVGSSRSDKTLVAQLKNWLPPRWLRPVPYVLPQGEAAGARSLAVFEVTEVQDQAVALARMAEYFVEIGRLEEAGMVALALGQAFADDPNSLIARGVVAGARREGAELTRVVGELKPLLERDEDADLPWDRRVVLAILLAQTRQAELAKPRIAGCLATLDEARLRQLSTMTLFRLQMIAKAYGLPIEDEALRGLALKLLPAEMRARLQ